MIVPVHCQIAVANESNWSRLSTVEGDHSYIPSFTIKSKIKTCSVSDFAKAIATRDTKDSFTVTLNNLFNTKIKLIEN